MIQVKYHQKLNHVNQALENEGLFIGEKDPKAYELLKNLEETYSSEEAKRKGDVNGYNYENEKIIKRTYVLDGEGKRKFKFVFTKSEKAENIKDHLEDITRSSFKDQITSIMGENEAEYETRETAENYIYQLREKEKLEVRKTKKLEELKEVIKEINTINNDIDEIKQNNPVKIDKESFIKSLRGKTARFIGKNKGSLAIASIGGIAGILSSVLSSLGIADTIKNGAKRIGELGEMIEKTGKTLKVMSKKIDDFRKYPLQTLSNALRLIGFIAKETAQTQHIIIGFIVAIILVYIIKWTVRLIRLR